MAFVDISIFAAFGVLTGADVTRTVTLDASVQFIGAGKIDMPLDLPVELLRETRGMVFVRGLAVQGDTTVASWSATVRKISPQ